MSPFTHPLLHKNLCVEKATLEIMAVDSKSVQDKLQEQLNASEATVFELKELLPAEQSASAPLQWSSP